MRTKFRQFSVMSGGILTAALLGGTLPAAAQATDASVTGSVRAVAGEPIAGAVVSVRNQAVGFEAQRLTGSDGRFSFVQLPLGGPYSVTATHPGHQAQSKQGFTLGLGDQVRLDFGLQASTVTLQPLVVTAPDVNTRLDRVGASTQITARQMQRLPVADRNFTDLASLAPSFGPALSIGGQRRMSTDVRVDGVQARNMLTGGEIGRGPYTLSMEAIREFEVVTNVYDVTQGRQGGGALNAATKFGTNEVQGSLFTYHRNENLTTADYTGREPEAFGLWQWGGSLGGPIVRDRMHYFLAFDRQDLSEPYYIADIRSDEDAVDLRIAPDSLARFIDILQRSYGLDPEGQTGAFTRTPVANTFFGRLDWQLRPGHRLTLRNNYGDWNNPQSVNGDQRITLREAWQSYSSRENMTLASLRSTLSRDVTNELKFGVTFAERGFQPNSNLPRGFVRVQSELPNGTMGDTRLQFGGHRFGPESNYERQLQLINTTHVQLGDQTLTFGTDNSLTYLDTYLAIEHGGLFEFESLSDLEAMRPSRYSRQVPLRSPEPHVRQHVLDAALFAQTEFRPLPRLGAMLGLRYDVTSFLTAAEPNPVVERTLGLRTDHAPTDWNNLQPRAQLTWDARGDGSEVLRVGGGVFNSQPHYYAHVNHIQNSGAELADVSLSGGAVPVPDFRRFREDPRSVPGLPIGAAAAGRPSYINLISPDFETPTTWKASAAYRRILGDRLSLGGSLLYARTLDNYHYIDRNLVDEPFFTIEGGRGVFVPASTINTRSGRTDNRFALKTRELGRVLELVSEAELRQRTLVLEAGLKLPREGSLDLSYTLNDTQDNSSYNCCVARTATFTQTPGDPRDLSATWGPAENDFRHKVAAFGALPAIGGFRLSGRYVGISGSPYSLLINGDVNGDDIGFNDLAFVFDPADPTTPPQIAASIGRVLDNADNHAAGCIRESLGRIARRNSCRAPWSNQLDVRLSRAFKLLPGGSTELIVDVFNFANLLNEDWGGRYVLNNWGRRQFLLNVKGFDPGARRYVYSVNENVGTARKTGDPYRIQLGVRHTF